MANVKKSPAKIVLDALTAIVSYNKTINNCERILSNDKLLEQDASLRTTLEASHRMATENRESEVGTIFRRVQEHVGSDEAALRKFAETIFPQLKSPATVK